MSLHRLHAVDATPAQAPGLAVGSRRAGRPPECWAAFDAVVNVTQDEYAGMAGVQEFVDLSLKFAYADAGNALADGRVAGVQAMSGTGACTLAGQFF